MEWPKRNKTPTKRAGLSVCLWLAQSRELSWRRRPLGENLVCRSGWLVGVQGVFDAQKWLQHGELPPADELAAGVVWRGLARDAAA